ncbi:hypothetical protein SMALA_4902 [Streptomyces malaysiensis subsp. malaysiensis]|nr:hypothetical protein SMALA_4902 [Streptomyces malaysiensis]
MRVRPGAGAPSSTPAPGRHCCCRRRTPSSSASPEAELEGSSSASARLSGTNTGDTHGVGVGPRPLGRRTRDRPSPWPASLTYELRVPEGHARRISPTHSDNGSLLRTGHCGAGGAQHGQDPLVRVPPTVATIIRGEPAIPDQRSTGQYTPRTAAPQVKAQTSSGSFVRQDPKC